jgi:hypothetical protein
MTTFHQGLVFQLIEDLHIQRAIVPGASRHDREYSSGSSDLA